MSTDEVTQDMIDAAFLNKNSRAVGKCIFRAWTYVSNRSSRSFRRSSIARDLSKEYQERIAQMEFMAYLAQRICHVYDIRNKAVLNEGSCPKVGYHQLRKKIAVMIVNHGTPDAPTVGAIYRYLHEFLGDPRVIKNQDGCGINSIWFYFAFSAMDFKEKYKRIWTEEGSPFHLMHTKIIDKLKHVLAQDKDHEYIVYHASHGRPRLAMSLRNYQKTVSLTCATLFPIFREYDSLYLL